MSKADLVTGAGLLAIVAGLTLIYVPAALVIGGLGAVVLGAAAERR